MTEEKRGESREKWVGVEGEYGKESGEETSINVCIEKK